MQQDMTMERRRLNHFLLLGTINHLIFLAIIFFAYASSGFKTSGDSVGGIMMVYALSLFMPQFVFGVFILITTINSLVRNKVMEGCRKRFAFYTVTLVIALITFFLF
jgi:hypothetical protein